MVIQQDALDVLSASTRSERDKLLAVTALSALLAFSSKPINNFDILGFKIEAISAKILLFGVLATLALYAASFFLLGLGDLTRWKSLTGNAKRSADIALANFVKAGQSILDGSHGDSIVSETEFHDLERMAAITESGRKNALRLSRSRRFGVWQILISLTVPGVLAGIGFCALLFLKLL